MPTFQDDEDGYEDWLIAHTDGYVVNAPRPGRSGVMVLHHQAPGRRCFHITPPWPGYRYTRTKIKHCFATRAELVAWYRRERPALVYCQTCAPEPL